MLNLRDIAFGLYGAMQFARLDRSAIQCFENTPEAFWRSFQAAIVTLPAYILLQLINIANVPVNAGPMRVLFVEICAYVVAWVLFPLIMTTISDTLQRGDKYYRFIVAWNWAIIPQVFLYLAVTALASSGTLPASMAALLGICVLAAVLFYQGFIATCMLDIRPPAVAMILVVDFAIALLLNQVTRSFYAGG